MLLFSKVIKTPTNNYLTTGGFVEANSRTINRILVIDDDEGVRNFITKALQRQHEVVCTDTAIGAAVELEKGDFQILITDWDLEDVSIDGLSLVGAINKSESIKKRCPDLKIILMSGTLSPKQLPIGVFFLSKPFLIEELKALICR